MNDNAEVTHDMKMVYLQILPFLLKRQSPSKIVKAEILNNYPESPLPPKKILITPLKIKSRGIERPLQGLDIAYDLHLRKMSPEKIKEQEKEITWVMSWIP
jgi:hypothetical protein